MKLFYFILTFLLLGITQQTLYSESQVLNNLERHTELINGIKYIEFSKIAVLFEDKMQSKAQNEIKLENGIIRVAPGSFFLFYEDDAVIKIAQLSSPAVEFRSQTFLPYQSLIDALISKEIISLNDKNDDEEDENKLKMLKFRNSYSIRNQESNLYNSEVNEVTPQINKALSREPLPPDYYYLPDNLIRNELEEVKPK